MPAVGSAFVGHNECCRDIHSMINEHLSRVLRNMCSEDAAIVGLDDMTQYAPVVETKIASTFPTMSPSKDLCQPHLISFMPKTKRSLRNVVQKV